MLQQLMPERGDVALQLVDEEPLDAERPIIDPHMHLWDVPPVSLAEPQRFLLDEFQDTRFRSGHNITHTVFMECHSMYRATGPDELKPIGETEFANGVAAQSADSACKVAHRIVGTADLLLGARVKPVLEAHLAVAGERFRGVRMSTTFSEADLFGRASHPSRRHLLLNASFREGARVLQELDLSLDVWCLHTQLEELCTLADTLPDLAIVLDHIGTPERLGLFAGREEETRHAWAQLIRSLARRPNVRIKIGGMGMKITPRTGRPPERNSSEVLAAKWRPYIETCIEAFTPRRCMFESNFPPDNDSGTYGATWNAFKIVTKNASEDDKDFLFRRTAAETYRV